MLRVKGEKQMKIKTTLSGREFTPEDALDRAMLEFPELTFVCHKEATRILNRIVVTLSVKHNSTTIYTGGLKQMGFVDGEVELDRLVRELTDRLLQRAAPDLAAWRAANPAPKPKEISSEISTEQPITSSIESDAASS
jgi:hypothetical protein